MARIPTARITESTTLSSVRFTVALAAALIGAALAARGAFGVATEKLSGGVYRTLDRLHQGQPVDTALREKARNHLLTSSDGAAIAMAGFVGTVEARVAGFGTPQARAWLSQAVADYQAGLARSPADGFSWLRLAGAEVLLNGPTPLASSAMQMSYFTVRRSEKADPLFLSLAAQIWPNLDASVQTFVLADIRGKWARQKLLLHSLALTNAGRVLLQTAVGPDPELDAWIAERNKREQVRRSRIDRQKALGTEGLRGGN